MEADGETRTLATRKSLRVCSRSRQVSNGRSLPRSNLRERGESVQSDSAPGATCGVPYVVVEEELGADGILLATCPHDRDPFPEIRGRIKGRMTYAMALIEFLGLGRERIEIYDMPEKGLIRQADIDKASLVFFIKPAGISDIIRLAKTGKKMPTKTTYFYPKVPSGLVIYKLNANKTSNIAH